MNKYRALFGQLIQDESGQDLIEYALVATLIGVAAITTMGTLATKISGEFTKIAGDLP